MDDIASFLHVAALLGAIAITYFATAKFKTTKFKADGEEAVNKKLLEMVEQQEKVRKECDELRERLRQSGS